MLRGDLELLEQGISEWLGLPSEKSLEAEAAASIVAENMMMWHKVLKQKFEKPGR